MNYVDGSRACRYCGSAVAHGPGCVYSPSGYHVEIGDPDFCIYCGSTGYGYGCVYSQEEDGKHKHGHGDGRCVWCGAVTRIGPGCAISPDGMHEL